MPRSIVMTEWSPTDGPNHSSRDQFLWQQMLLSLLYDEVLAKDETVLCSTRMARWFADGESFRLFEELLDCGGLVVLKRPLETYPEALRERAVREPVSARSEHLENFSVHNSGASIRFSDKQRHFHTALEHALQTRRHAHRDAGSRKISDANLMAEFASLFRTVLTERRYSSWLKQKFGHIDQSVVQQFVDFIDAPERAVEHLQKARPGQSPKYTLRRGGLEFTTPLAVQLAATYHQKTARDLRDLMMTVFARPYCEQEGADGWYGRQVQALPLESEIEEAEAADRLHVVRVETIPLTLPKPEAHFADLINRVRSMPSGRALRREMGRLGPELTFASARKAWNDVAADLAGMLSSPRAVKLHVHAVAVETPKQVAYGVLVGTALAYAFHGPSGPLPFAEAALGGISAPLLDRLVGSATRSYRRDRQRLALTESLRGAVRFSCVRHPTISSA